MKHFLYISACSLILFACGPRTPEMKTVPIDNLFTVDLPDNLKPGYDMHRYAGLQYYDPLTDFYVIGMEDAKANLGKIQRKRLKIENYFAWAERTAFENADSIQLESIREFVTEDGLQARIGDYFVQSTDWANGLPLFYRLGIYEHEDYFFQIITWMPYEVHCERFIWIDRISESIRLINQHEQANL